MLSSILAERRLFRAVFPLLLNLLAVSLCRAASATVYYSATDGLASNSGLSWSAPRDLSSALAGTLSGDQVWVKAGTYTGNFTATDGVTVYGGFAGTETSFSQRNVAANPTVLDGNNSGTVYTIPTGATKTNTLDGFTVQHGSGAGGGLFDRTGDTLNIVNCTVSNDDAGDSAGGGIYADGPSMSVSNCTFSNDSSRYSNGGGILFQGVSTSLSISHCTFSGDSTPDGYGGGVIAGGAGSLSISDCVFSADSAALGGGIFIGASAATVSVTRCSFFGDSASVSGGGIYADYGDFAITDCTFGGSNTNDVNSPQAIAVYSAGSASGPPTVPAIVKDCLILGSGTLSTDPDGIDVDATTNNDTSYITFANNTFVHVNASIGIASEHGAIAVANNIFFESAGGINDTGTAAITSSHNDFYGTAYNDRGTNPGTSDLFDYPVFVDYAAGNYRLTSGSPLIDTGDDSYVVTGDTDLDGNPRIQGSHVDIGAYEYVPVPPTITSFTPTSGPIGTVVTVTGTNLNGVTAVRFHNASAKTFSANAAGTQLTVTVPSGAATGTITVTTPGGSVKTAMAFTVTATTLPTIASFTPTAGPAGTSVTITGTNFTGASTVNFHGTAAASFTVVSATSIKATVPAGATTGTVSVTTPSGTATSSSSFTVTVPAPTITSFTPTSGPVGTVVTITGTNLNGVTAVRFHNASAKTFSANAGGTQLTVSVPTGAATGTITVTTPGGSVKTATPFKVN